MADLLQLRDALALSGQASASQLSARLNLSAAITEAMLERLVLLGKAERVKDHRSGSPNGACRRCVQSTACATPYYRLCVGQSGLGS